MSRMLFSVGAAATLLGNIALADSPRVATDIAPVHSLVARVMDGLGTPDLVIAQGASPHEYNLRPSEARALQEADLVFWIGEDLTPWMEDSIETLAENAEVIELLGADGVTLLEFRERVLFEEHDHDDHADEEGHDDAHDDHASEEDHGDAHDEHGDEVEHKEHADEHHDGEEHDDHADEKGHGDEHDDHAEHDGHADGHEGHAHGAYDPHAWLSPENAAVWLNTIAAALSAADPENAGTYYANAAAGRDELMLLSGEINTVLDPLRGESFVVFHDAYQYFENSFDFPASGAISLGDASDPSPVRIAEIQGRVASEGIACVLSEPQFNQNLVATVMDGTQANTAVLDPLGNDIAPGAGLYPQLLRNLAATLADCL